MKLYNEVLHNLFQMAKLESKKSNAVRLKVGCVLATNPPLYKSGHWVSSFNSMPDQNESCEIEVFNEAGDTVLETKKEILHAEFKAITLCVRDGISTKGAVIVTTHSPCIDCAKLIWASGVAAVYYWHHFRDLAGIEFLKKMGVEVNSWDEVREKEIIYESNDK